MDAAQPTGRGRLRRLCPTPFAVAVACCAALGAVAWLGDAGRFHLERERELALRGEAERELADVRRRLGEQVRLTEQVLGRRLVMTEQRLAADLLRARGAFAELAAWRRAVVTRAEEQSARIAALEGDLASSVHASAALRAALDEARVRRAEAERRERTLADQRARLDQRLVGLELRLAGLEAQKRQLIERVSSAAREDIEHATRVIGLTGLDAEEIVEGGQGGPFVPLGGSALRGAIEALESQLDEWSRLRRVLRGLPLAAPLAEFAVSGRFGPRHDPLNGRRAMHWGLDLVAPLRAPIHAAGPGTVVRAEWFGSYGRTVDIDHGAGIQTRYAHLRAITVKRGQSVAAGERLGLLGSSGRTSGPHLHYEVMVGGERVDPARFLKAGRLLGAARRSDPQR